MKDVLAEFRAHLVSEGLVRVPRVAGSVPPCWVMPQGGAPAPGEGDLAVEVGEQIVVALWPAAGFATRPFEGFLREEMVEVEIRCAPSAGKSARELAERIRRAVDDRRSFELGTIHVEECRMWRDFSLEASDPSQGHVFVGAFRVQFRASALDV